MYVLFIIISKSFFFQKLPYPKQIYFIVGNEFCERFSYYGMKGMLNIELNKVCSSGNW